MHYNKHINFKDELRKYQLFNCTILEHKFRKYEIEKEVGVELSWGNIIPVFLSQMGVLLTLNPKIYEGYLTHSFLQFLSKKFKKRVVFLLNKQGFVKNVLIMSTTIEERVVINRFFTFHLDDLPRYQIQSTEYDPDIELFYLSGYPDNKNKYHSCLHFF